MCQPLEFQKSHQKSSIENEEFMTDTLDLRQYIQIALKWWWLIALMTVVGAATSYAVSQRQPPVYQATTTIMVGQSIKSTELDTRDIYISERLAQTYANIVRRQPVMQGVVDALQLPDTWQNLRDRVSVNSVRDTQLLEISVEAGSPEEAQVTADEVARQLIEMSPTSLEQQSENENQQFVRQRLADLQAKIEAGQTRLAALEDSMQGELSAEQVQTIQSEITDLETLISGWENNHTQLLLFIEGKASPNYLAIIEPAQADTSPVRPKVMQNTLLGGVVGLLLALGIVFLLEYLDDTLKSPGDLSASTGLTALGAIGRITGRDYAGKLITSKELFSAEAEAYRMIRSNIQFMAIDHPARAILITSPTPAEGKSTTVANLGVVMAQAGLKTVIVDADLRRPTQHNIFEIANVTGLTDLLRAPDGAIDRFLRPTTIENLRLLTSGALPPNPSELLGSQRMSQLQAQLLAQADVLLFDSPPALAVTDAMVLSSKVDGVVLVTEAGQTRREAARQAVVNLDQAGAKLLGGIVNQFSRKRGGYYYYYHHYYASSPNGRGPDTGANSAHVHKRRRPRWKWLPFLR